MGQYYAYINSVKKEYFHPHDMGSGAKAIEQFGATSSSVLTYLLIKSDGQGGGDVFGKYLGHWVGDPIVVIGDYDSSGLYQLASKEFKNISKEVLVDYNKATRE
jgi:hypothetical protein